MAFALFILYLVLSYIHPGEIVPALAPYRFAYWTGMSGLAVAMVSLLARRRDVLATIQLWTLMFFAAVLGLSLMVADRWLGAPILALQQFGPSLTMFLLALCSVTSLSRVRMAAACVIALTVILTLQGAAAYHFGYRARTFLIDGSRMDDDSLVMNPDDNTAPDSADDRAEETPDDDEGQEPLRIRGLGLMHDPNDLAVGMIVALGLIGGVWTGRSRVRAILFGIAGGALVYGVYLTRSRGGAVALVVVLWRVAARRLGRGAALALLVALGAGTMALDFGGRSLSTQLDESASGRVEAWTEGLEMLKAQPILGVGYGQFLDHHELTAHNSLVLCFAETGLVGCFLWVGLLVVTGLELRALRQLPGDETFDRTTKQWAGALQLSLLGFVTAAFFLSRTFVPTLYLVIGLSAALSAIARAAGRSIPLPALPTLGSLVFACEAGSIAVVYAIVKLHLA